MVEVKFYDNVADEFLKFVPSRELHSLATLVRLSLVDLPSANGFDKPFAASKFED